MRLSQVLRHTNARHLRVRPAGGGEQPPPGPTAPTAGSWTTSVDGTAITATLSEAGCLPASGTGGFTLGGTTATVTTWTITGTVLRLALSEAITAGATLTLDYDHTTASVPITAAAGTLLADLSGVAVANAVGAPPAAIPADAVAIDAAWRAANAATYGGDAASGPWVLPDTDGNYYLTEDLTAEGTAFIVGAHGITLWLGETTLQYDGAGVLATQPVVTGRTAAETAAIFGFETAGPGGDATALGWDLSGAPGFARVARDRYGFWGDWILRGDTSDATPQVILSDPITLPRAGVQYFAHVMPAANYDTTVRCEIVDASDSAIVYGKATNSNIPNRQAVAWTTWDNPVGGPTAVRLKITCTGVAGVSRTFRLDFAGIRFATVVGIWSSESVFGGVPAPVQLSGFAAYLTSGRGFTLRGPGSVVQAGRSWYSPVVLASTAQGVSLRGCTLRSQGPCSGILNGIWSHDCVVDGVSFGAAYETIARRQDLDALIDLSNAGSGTVTNCTLLPGTTCHIPIKVMGSSSAAAVATVTDNDLSGFRSLAADGYAVVLWSITGSTIARNTITPVSGRGILLDGFSSRGSQDVTIADNTITVQEQSVLEYPNRTGLEVTGIRLREFGSSSPASTYHHNIVVRGNTVTARTFAGTDPASLSYPFASDAWVNAAKALATNGGYDPPADLGPHFTIEDNTLEATCEFDPAVQYGAFGLVVGDKQAVTADSYAGNVCRSNFVPLSVGDPDSYDSPAINVTLTTTTLEQLAAPAGVPFAAVLNWSLSDASNVLVATPSYRGGAAEGVDFQGPFGAAAAVGSAIAFGWRLTVTVTDGGGAVSGATVTVTDAASATVATGTTDAAGVVVLAVPVTTYAHTGGGAVAVTTRTPLSVTATVGVKTGTATGITPVADTPVAVAIV